MPNTFTNLVPPAGNGVGPAADVSIMGPIKTITVQGVFTGVVIIEYSEDGGTTFAQLASFAAGGKQTIKFATQFMRVRRAGVGLIPGTPNIDVGSDDTGQLFLSLPVPAGNGVGAAVGTALLGTLNTVVVGGTFTGNVIVEISEDNIVWTQCLFYTRGGGQTKNFVARFMRVRRSGVGAVPGTPVVDVGAVNDPSAPAAGNTLNQAYNSGGPGVGRTIVADAGAVVIQSTAPDNNNILEITKNPAGAQSGNAVDLTMGATTTGNAVSIDHDGSGNAVQIQHGGAGDAVGINLDGAAVGAQAIVVTETAFARNTRMVSLTRDAAAVSGIAHVLAIDNDGSGNSIDINHGGGGDGLNIALDGTTTSANAIVVTESAFARTAAMMSLSRNAAATATASAMFINMDGAGDSIDINHGGAGDAIDIALDGTAVGARAIVVTETAVARNTPMVSLTRAATATVTASVFFINNDGAGGSFDINHGGAGDAIDIALDGASLLGQAIVVTETAVARTAVMMSLTRDALTTAAAHALEITQPGAGDAINVVSGRSFFGGAVTTSATINVNSVLNTGLAFGDPFGFGTGMFLQEGGTAFFQQVTGSGTVLVIPDGGEIFLIGDPAFNGFVGVVPDSTSDRFFQLSQPGVVAEPESAFLITGGAHTVVTNSERIDVEFDLSRTVQFTGVVPLATQRAFVVRSPTYTSDTPTKTIATAVTMDITGAPVAGLNLDITTSLALRVGGPSKFGNTAPTAVFTTAMEVDHTFTDPTGAAGDAGLFVGIVFDETAAPSGAIHAGALLSLVVGAANTQNWTALGNAAAFISLANGPAGTISNLSGVFVDSVTAGAGTITSLYGIRVRGMTQGTTNNYGIFIDTPLGGATDNDAIHVVGGRTFLGGNLAHTGTNIGLYSAAVVAQHSSTGQTAGFVAGAGSAVLDDSTFTGGTGAAAYTIGDVVRAIKLIGIMAA